MFTKSTNTANIVFLSANQIADIFSCKWLSIIPTIVNFYVVFV